MTGGMLTFEKRTLPGHVGWILGWVWTIMAGGGGAWLLWTRGPWRLTNGWFALCSGLSACPLLGWLLKRYLDVRVSGWMQFSLAALFFVAGRVALKIGI